jgi:hypothetical protein
MDILAEMAEAYARCRSCRDRGEVRSVVRAEGREFHRVLPFETAFVRPDLFRFEIRDRYFEGSELPWKRVAPDLFSFEGETR